MEPSVEMKGFFIGIYISGPTSARPPCLVKGWLCFKDGWSSQSLASRAFSLMSSCVTGGQCLGKARALTQS